MKVKTYNIIKWVFFPFFFIWCLIQNFIGLILLIVLKCQKQGERRKSEDGIVYFTTDRFSGVSLGYFAFLSSDSLVDCHHEFGHQLQSLLLGPLYLLMIGLPSGIVNIFNLTHDNNYKYYLLPWEAWADKWGGVKHKNLSYFRDLK